MGVVQARANVGGEQDPVAADGYVQEAFVKQLATEAGFTFDKASDINANPHDPKDAQTRAPFHPGRGAGSDDAAVFEEVTAKEKII